MKIGQKIRALEPLGGHFTRVPLNSEPFDGWVHVDTVGTIVSQHPIMESWWIASFPRGLDKGHLLAIVKDGPMIKEVT